MKPISSSAGSSIDEMKEARAEEDQDLRDRGTLGYRRPRSEPLSEERAPTKRIEPRTISVQTMSGPFLKLSPLPEQKPISVVLPSGKAQTMLALAEPSDLSRVQAEIAFLEEELAPADPLVIVARIRALLGHYGAQAPTDPNLLKMWAEDWINDLEGVSAKAFEASVVLWRQSKERFKPSPGLLLAVIRDLESPLRRRLERCFELEWVATKTRPEKQLPGQGD
jgi:hypothetical protein